jgi:hypothetical protein
VAVAGASDCMCGVSPRFAPKSKRRAAYPTALKAAPIGPDSICSHIFTRAYAELVGWKRQRQ